VCVCVWVSVCVYLWRTRVGFRVQGFRTHAYTRMRARMHAPHSAHARARVYAHIHTSWGAQRTAWGTLSVYDLGLRVYILRRAGIGVRATLDAELRLHRASRVSAVAALRETCPFCVSVVGPPGYVARKYHRHRSKETHHTQTHTIHNHSTHPQIQYADARHIQMHTRK